MYEDRYRERIGDNTREKNIIYLLIDFVYFDNFVIHTYAHKLTYRGIYVLVNYVFYFRHPNKKKIK